MKTKLSIFRTSLQNVYTWTLKLSPRTWGVRLNPPWFFFTDVTCESSWSLRDRRVFAASSLTKKKTPRIQSPQRQGPEVFLWMLPTFSFTPDRLLLHACWKRYSDMVVLLICHKIEGHDGYHQPGFGNMSSIALPSQLESGLMMVPLSFFPQRRSSCARRRERSNQSDREKDIQSFSNKWM